MKCIRVKLLQGRFCVTLRRTRIENDTILGESVRHIIYLSKRTHVKLHHIVQGDSGSAAHARLERSHAYTLRL